MALPPALRRPLVAMGFLDPLDIAPIRAASPEEPGAQPTQGVISRSGEGDWIPGGWLKAVTANPDEILNKGGEGLKLYDQLLDDDVAFSTLQQRRLAIIEREWEVVPGDENDPRSVKAADELRAMLKEVGWDRVTGLMHYGFWYGYAVGEAIYTVRDYDGRPIVWLSDIVVPDRRWFAFDGTGTLRMTGLLGATVEGQELPPNKFWTLRTGASHDFAFYGLGLAHWAYWPIFFKRAALRFWALYLEKFGSPTVGIEFPETDSDEQKQRRLQAAVAIGQDRAVLLPEGTITGDKVKIFEATRAGNGASSYLDFLTEQNEALMRIILGQPGTSKATPGGLGGDGQAKKDEGVKREIVKSDSDQISESFHRTIAKWLTVWNHGEDVAPPHVYRKLDDEEDLNTTAERDVKLNGIGIKRTEESVKDVYGEGYELDRVSEEDKAKQALALQAAKAPVPGQLPAPAANDNRQAANKAKAAEFAARFDIDGKAPLYVARWVLPSTARKIVAWAKAAGVPNVPEAAELHTTLLYSKTPVDWFDMGDHWGTTDRITIGEGGPRAVVQFDGGSIVLRFHSSDLSYRHAGMIERGASSDYPDFKPHITIGKVDEGAEFDVSTVEPFVGELEFGPEIFEPIREKDIDPAQFNFAAEEEEAIDRLVAALVDEADPVFAAMGDVLKESLQGVSTLEGARVAILEAMERLPVERLAKLTALPMLATRAASVADDEAALTA